MTKVENVTFRNSEQKLSEQEILDFEKDLCVKLPDFFVKHYKNFNGGFPNANWSEGVNFTCPLRHFFSIKYGEETIERRIKELENLNGLLPFAMNKIMGYFCIGTDEKNLGQIFYYRKRPVPKIDYKKMYDMNEVELHCSDFQSFLKNLQTDQFYDKVPKAGVGWVEDFEAYTKRW